MKIAKILLTQIEDIKSFVNIVNRVPYNVDLCDGHQIVNGKSILGIFSLDLSNPIAVNMYSDRCEELLRKIKPFLAA